MTTRAASRSSPGVHVPAGYASLTAYICVPNARRVLEFVQAAFDAKVLRTDSAPDGTLGHTEVEIAGMMVMLADGGGKWPEARGGFYLYVEDVDAAYHRALAAGARSLMEPTDQPYGDRSGGVLDPGGIQWWLATPIRKAP